MEDEFVLDISQILTFQPFFTKFMIVYKLAQYDLHSSLNFLCEANVEMLNIA